jgi:hypothetical protein
LQETLLRRSGGGGTYAQLKADLDGFRSSFDYEIETEVIELVRKEKYREAIQLIINSYRLDEGISKIYQFSTWELDRNIMGGAAGHITRQRDEEEMKSLSDDPSYKEFTMKFDITFLKILDKNQRDGVISNAIEANSANKILRSINFGDVVRSISHEFTHINDRLGKNELKTKLNKEQDVFKAEREFRAYHLSYTNNALPKGTIAAQMNYWGANAFKIYNQMTKEKQVHYKSWLQQELKFIFALPF